MTVKELKEKIKSLPDNMDVMIRQVNGEEFSHSLLESAESKDVTFLGEVEEPKERCLVLTDEI